MIIIKSFECIIVLFLAIVAYYCIPVGQRARGVKIPLFSLAIRPLGNFLTKAEVLMHDNVIMSKLHGTSCFESCA